jgi:C4-dicarboxylate-specific signal transduction histidine kinase
VSGSAERFIALLVGIIAILGGIGAMIRLLVTISMRVGQVVQRFDDHIKSDDEIHRQTQERLRDLEQYRNRRNR